MDIVLTSLTNGLNKIVVIKGINYAFYINYNPMYFF